VCEGVSLPRYENVKGEAVMTTASEFHKMLVPEMRIRAETSFCPECAEPQEWKIGEKIQTFRCSACGFGFVAVRAGNTVWGKASDKETTA